MSIQPFKSNNGTAWGIAEVHPNGASAVIYEPLFTARAAKCIAHHESENANLCWEQMLAWLHGNGWRDAAIFA